MFLDGSIGFNYLLTLLQQLGPWRGCPAGILSDWTSQSTDEHVRSCPRDRRNQKGKYREWSTTGAGWWRPTAMEVTRATGKYKGEGQFWLSSTSRYITDRLKVWVLRGRPQHRADRSLLGSLCFPFGIADPAPGAAAQLHPNPGYLSLEDTIILATSQ